MPLFDYEVIESDGRVARGTLAGPSSMEVAQRLQAGGAVPVQILPRRRAQPRARGTDSALVARLCLDLAALLNAGMRVDDALMALADSGDLQKVARQLPLIAARVRAGQRFSEALAEQPGLAPGYLLGLVGAGEETGDLAGVLEAAGRIAARRAETAKAVRASLTYPAILLATSGLSIGVLFTVVIPQLEPLFAGVEDRLPWVTIAVLEVSRLTRDYGMAALVILAGLVLGVRLALETAAGRRRLDDLLLSLPVMGDLVRAAQAASFARLASGLLSGGLVLAQALELARAGVGNSQIQEAVSAVRVRVERGERLADSLEAAGAFPRVVTDLARVGESGGTLPAALARAAEILEERVRGRTQRLLTILGPMVTLLLGGVVALTLASVVLAIMSVNTIAL